MTLQIRCDREMCAKMVASCSAVGKGLLRDVCGLLREQTAVSLGCARGTGV